MATQRWELFINDRAEWVYVPGALHAPASELKNSMKFYILNSSENLWVLIADMQNLYSENGVMYV